MARFYEWLSAMPTDWKWARLGHVAKIYAGGTPQKDNPDFWGGDIPWLNSGCVNQWMVTEPSEYITEAGLAGSSARWVPKGSLLMALAGQGKTKGMAAQLQIDATCNQSLAAIVPHEVEANYLLYWLTSKYKSIRGMASEDTRDGLNLTMLGQIPIPIPPRDEQNIIANYLDREIARIDHLLREKEELIDLLKEWRQSIIFELVSRGLNKDATLQKSAFSRVGVFPAHWEAKKLKHILTMHYGDSLSAETREEGEVPVFGSNGIVGTHSCANTHEPTIIIGRKGSYGKLNYSDTAGFCIDTAYHVTLNASDDLRFVFYALMTLGLDTMSKDTGVPGLSREDAYKSKVFMPPLEEQKLIAAHLDRETASVDKLIDHTQSEIELLKELQSATIADAVLGRIDLRHA